MKDTLERERIADNILDRLDRLTERVLRIEERMRLAELTGDLELEGTVTANSLVLRTENGQEVKLSAIVLRGAPKLEMVLYSAEDGA